MRIQTLLLLTLLPAVALAAGKPNPEKIAKKHQTSLGLYVHPQEAYEMIQAGAGKVHLLDVRTPGEYVFLGHPAMARNIPYSFLVEEWSEALQKPDMRLNADFVEQVKAHYQPGDTIILMCRSGDRSARGVDLLAKAGFTKAYTMLEGFQGDMIDGRRSKFGWANHGLPWTYELDPKLVYQGKNE
ncbi:MAG: rhodanese-like domain-containing protein [Verrucomicrobiota bacterium]